MKRLLALAATMLPACDFPPAVEAATQPNVLFIVADDMRPDAVSALGNPAIRTPALDALVRRGTSFINASCAYPICVASRAEILTGCTAFRALQPYPTGKLNEALPTWPAVMQAAGYATYYVGKWHTTGTPHQRGYTAAAGWYGSGGGKHPLTYPKDHRGVPVTGYTGWVLKDDDGTPHPERGIGLTPNISEAFGDAAVELIERPRDGKPFFLHVNFTAPHDPRFFPRGYERAYDPAKLPLPKNFATAHPFDHGNINGRDEVLLPRPLTPEIIRDELAVYYALIEHMDAQFGRITAALERHGLAENTLVIFTSDHGMAVGSHGLAGKQNMYDHTIRVPLVVAGPGVTRDRRTAEFVYLRDLFPTVCERCGIAVPEGLDGSSFLAVLRDPAARGPHEFLVGYFTNTQRMLRDGKWKYVRYPAAGKEQLFDLANDPHELRDLSSSKLGQSLVPEYRERLTIWLREHGDPLAWLPESRPSN